MTTDRIHIRLHAANNRPRVSLIALTLVAAAFAVAPASSLAAGEDEYVPSKPTGSGTGGTDSGDFSVPGAGKSAAPAETPAPVESAPVPTTPAGPTAEEIAAAEAAAEAKRLQKKLERKAALLKKKAKKKREAADAAWEELEALRATGGISAVPGTQTAADIARTAFEDEGAGPLPLVLGILLLVTGVGLVVRYRRTGRGSA